MISETVGEKGAFGSQFIDHAGPFAQLDNLGIQRTQRAQAVRIGANRIAQYARVTAIILGPRRRKTIPEAIQLLGVDGEHLKSTIEKTIHNRTVRNLYGDRNAVGLATRAIQDPVKELAQPFPGVGEGLLAENGTLGSENTDLVGPGTPVNTREKHRSNWIGHG